jgi:hypothetical protein
MPFNSHPRRTNPSSLPEFISTFLQNLIQRAHVMCSYQKEVYSFVKSFPRLFWRLSRTHYIQRHGVGNKLITFFPYLDSVFNIF